MDVDEKVRENRLRRMAKRLGLVIQKSRVRTIHLDDIGEYMIIDLYGNYVVAGERFDCSLDDVEDFLTDYESGLRRERED